MPSQYVVLQYGNVMTGEYLNIGVYAYDMDEEKPEVYSKFLENWTRVNAAFPTGKQGKECGDTIMESLLDSWLRKIETKEALQKAMKDANSPWSSLMFTQPRASLEAPEILVEAMAETFLVQ